MPSHERITEDVIELFGLANARYVSMGHGHLTTHPYLSKAIENNADQLIVEKILSIAIKFRFLDDQNKVLNRHDRENAGKLIDNSSCITSKPREVGLREALNKIIHAQSIEVRAQSTNITVDDHHTPIAERELVIKAGSYSGFSIYIRTEGVAVNNKPWVFNTEISHLINEALRVLHFENDKSIIN